MKRYKFRLEPLLFQRQTLEEQVQNEFAVERNRMLELQQELERCYDAYHTHLNKQHSGAMAPAELRLHMNYTTVLYERVLESKERLREQRKKVDEVRERLLAHHKDTRIVEILKDKDRERYEQEVKRKETSQMDEFSSIRHAAKNTGKKDG